MFGFGKKEKKPLLIRTRDVFSIIKSDYDEGVPFFLIDFMLDGRTYTMGSSLMEDGEERKEDIYFVFQDREFDTYEEFADSAEINGVNLSSTDTIIEITRAGIVNGDALIRSPWGDTRLSKYAIQT